MLYDAIKNLHFADDLETLIEKIEKVANNDTICSIVRIPTYEVLFASPKLKFMLGEYQGLKCYEYIYGKTKPCIHCDKFKEKNHSSKPLVIQVEKSFADKNFYTFEKTAKLRDNQVVKINFYYQIENQISSNENGYVNIDTTQIAHDVKIQNVLKDLVEFYDADSAYICEFSDIDNKIQKTFSYEAFNFETKELNIQNLPYEKLSKFRDMLLRKGIICLRDFDQILEKNKDINTQFTNEDKASHMFISIVVDKSYKALLEYPTLEKTKVLIAAMICKNWYMDYRIIIYILQQLITLNRKNKI